MLALEKLLAGKDLRSIGRSNSIIGMVNDQADFDDLIKFLFHSDRIIVMHAADAAEKISSTNPQYLTKHKKKILDLFYVAQNKELKWHLSLLVARLRLNEAELGKAWNELTLWAKNRTNSRIVRVNAVQSLFELTKRNTELLTDFGLTLLELEKENIPSINARIRNIRKELQKR